MSGTTLVVTQAEQVLAEGFHSLDAWLTEGGFRLQTGPQLAAILVMAGLYIGRPPPGGSGGRLVSPGPGGWAGPDGGALLPPHFERTRVHRLRGLFGMA